MIGRLITTAICALVVTLPAAAEKVVLGKLGQTIEQTSIFSKPGKNSKVYYKAKPYEYLVLQTAPNSDSYFRVLLQNGKYGYIHKDAVARLPYDVTRETGASSLASRGGRSSGTTRLTPQNRADVAAYSKNFDGTPYVWGGNDPLNGIDCSGFVKFLYGKIGVSLPRTAAEQVKVGQPITRLEDLRAGDRLYFWSKSRNKVGHTGIYLGNGYFQHSSTNNKGVATDYLTKHWLDMLVAARR